MHDTDDGILALLQDIKEILYGIALILVAIFLCALGVCLDSDWAVLVAIIGLITLIAGLAYARHGFNHHEVVEKQD